MNARTDTVIRITPIEYREFAEIAKASGMVLRLFDQPAEIIGLRTGIDASVIDATSDTVVGSLIEPPSLLLCTCLLYTSPSPRDVEESRMPSSA